MSLDRLVQASACDVEAKSSQPHGDDQRAQFGGWPIDRPFPVLLTAADLQLVFQIREAYYFKLKRLGRFTRFEAPRLIGPVRYRGDKVRDFLRHEPTAARTFGGKRGPRRAPVQFVSKTHAPQSARSSTSLPLKEVERSR